MRLSSPFVFAAAMLVTAAASAAPRTILHGGKVFTSDSSAPWAEAVVIEGDHVVAVGTNAQILPLANNKTKKVNLGGRLVIPGLNDAHVHVTVPEGAYLNTTSFIPGPGPTLAEVKGMIAGAASGLPAGTWLFAFIGSNVFDDDTANRFALDTVSPNHPVILFGWTGHGMWLNTRAMQVLGISATEPDPLGGYFERLPGSNVITGEAHEYAEFGIRRKLLGLLSNADLVAQYQAFAADAVKLGFTSLQDMAVGLKHARALSVLDAANLPLRVRSICFPLTPGENCELDGGSSDGGMVRASGVKWVTDGTPVERLAFVETPYADRPGEVGQFNLPAGPLHRILQDHRTGNRTRNQVLFHSVGDGAIGLVLDALEDTGGACTWSDRRPRIEHGDLLFPWDYGRARDLGAVVVQNPTHLALAGVFAERFEPAVFAELEPLKTLLEEGIPLALGTDGIGRAQSPFVDLFLATIHPTRPSEALTLEQALVAYTHGSAYAELQEHKKGRIAPGQLADIAVLSQDIFLVPPPAIPATTSVLTIVDGKVVWDAGVL